MHERQIVEKTIRPDGSNERIEICLGGVVHVLSLEKGEEIARRILSLMGTNVTQPEAEIERLLKQIAEKDDYMLILAGDLMWLEKDIRKSLGGE